VSTVTVPVVCDGIETEIGKDAGPLLVIISLIDREERTAVPVPLFVIKRVRTLGLDWPVPYPTL
jgi:hypothetical protein